MTVLFRQIICEGWHFTHTWTALASPDHFTKREFWGHKTSSTLPLLILVLVLNQERQRSCIRVLWVPILPRSRILEVFQQCGLLLCFFNFITCKRSFVVALHAECSLVVGIRHNRLYHPFHLTIKSTLLSWAHPSATLLPVAWIGCPISGYHH
jgi:hypothetical protein